jgi:DNA repair exonuclease SbcCD nuclease subunit
MSVLVVHAADLHIDSPLRGLSRYDGAPHEAVARATRSAFQNLIQLCLDRSAALLLLAGDLFDGVWRDFNTGLFFMAEIARLRAVGCNVVLLRGNHDADSVVEKSLTLPSHAFELNTAAPQTMHFENLGISVTGQGFAKRAITTDLGAAYPAPDPHVFSIAMLHTSLDGREGHDAYAPTKLSTLLDKGYGYWALGHVHTREDVHAQVVFPGNLQGRHARETGPKGVMLLDIDNGVLLSREFVALDVVRWEHLHVDVSAATTSADAIDLAAEALDAAADAAESRTLAARVTLEGRTSVALMREPEALLAELRARALGRPIYVEKLRIQTQLAGARRAHPLEPYLEAVAAELGADAAQLLSDLPSEIGAEVRLGFGEDARLVADALRYVTSKLQGD